MYALATMCPSLTLLLLHPPPPPFICILPKSGQRPSLLLILPSQKPLNCHLPILLLDHLFAVLSSFDQTQISCALYLCASLSPLVFWREPTHQQTTTTSIPCLFTIPTPSHIRFHILFAKDESCFAWRKTCGDTSMCFGPSFLTRPRTLPKGQGRGAWSTCHEEN